MSKRLCSRHVLALILGVCVAASPVMAQKGGDGNGSNKATARHVQKQQKRQKGAWPEKKELARNIIILISDGCGYNHVDAASLYQYGRTGKQEYEKFPVRVGMSTYMVPGEYDPLKAWADFDYVKSGYTDSAAAATAMSTGVKTYPGAIGVDVNREALTHFMEKAEEKGKATGVVTSVEFSHATPAGFVAHNESRDNYAEIANEMIYRSAADVIMGCGAPDYDNSGQKLTEYNTHRYVGGETTWADMVDNFAVTGADADGDGKPDEWQVIRSREEFQELGTRKSHIPSRIIGIPYVYKTLQQSRDGDGNAEPYVVPQIQTVPTLAEMTRAALNVLAQDRDGFCLMIEGGAVDWASHANQSGRVIEEEIDFNKAVEAVIDWVRKNSNWGETLVIVTGDHECGYLTGPDSNPGWEPLVNNGKGNQPGMEWHSGSHTNSLIPFHARGAAARLFQWAATGIDPIRGRYLDNTAIGVLSFDILGVENPN
jgi:alkaline phosphatase